MRGGAARKLDMHSAADTALFLKCSERSNPYSALAMVDNPGLLMFYCAGALSDCVYYSEVLDAAAVIVRGVQGDLCCDLFCEEKVPLRQALGAFGRLLLGEHLLVEASAQNGHRGDLVLQLALLVLGLDDQAGGQVRDAHRRVGI